VTGEWPFRIGLALLFTHELDAVARAEWRVLPLTSWLPDDAGFAAFVLLHVPLFAWLIGRIGHLDRAVRRYWQTVVSIFLVVHVGLHLLFSGHAHYEFHGAMSKLLIFGAGAFGALALLLRRREASST
jgi:hypothetical protein